MSSDYGEHLTSAALRRLAAATGRTPNVDVAAHFSQNQDDLLLALGSDEAASVLADELSPATTRDPIDLESLTVAIAVHRTADEICRAGWTLGDLSPIDLSLLDFCGQLENRRFIVDLLLSGRAPVPTSALGSPDYVPPHWSAPPSLSRSRVERPVDRSDRERVLAIAELVHAFDGFERPGLLRMLGDEALLSAGSRPRGASDEVLDAHMNDALRSVLPRALHANLDDMAASGRSLLDAHLAFGPIWYRLASASLLHRPNRRLFANIARDFGAARQFLVRIHQGPLSHR